MYLLWPKIGLYLYASTEEILLHGLSKTGLNLGVPQKISTDCGEILCITRNGMRSRSEFSIDHLFSRWHWSSLWDDSPPLSTSSDSRSNAEHTRSEYLLDLKALAGYYGYAPSAIDSMLADGYSAEEIEEIPDLMVAKLLGHCDLKMLAKIYDHTDTETLRTNMKRAVQNT